MAVTENTLTFILDNLQFSCFLFVFLLYLFPTDPVFFFLPLRKWCKPMP